MIDVKLTNNGDMFMKEKSHQNKLAIKFICADHDVFRMQFIQKMSPQKSELGVPSRKCKIRFLTEEGDTPTTVATVLGEDELRQRIMIKLRTELGELPSYPEFGSILYEERHTEITRQDLTARIQTIILDEISSFVPNASVKVARKKVQTYFRNHNLDIYIYQDGELLYSFEYEV